MANIILALSVFLMAGAILYKAFQLGDGDLWQGLKRFFDTDYRTDREENTDIEHGLFLLSERLDAYFPRGWSIQFEQNQPGRPPYVRLVSQEGGVCPYDSPTELLRYWSQPHTVGVKGVTTDIH